MRKTSILLFAILMPVSTAFAQETYENGNITGGDLNGTARYVGMGGAMDALGADLSTVSSNPAGTALFRRSAAAITMGYTKQTDVEKFADGKKNTFNFDQAGFVISKKMSDDLMINFALNYHQSRNFNQILQAAGQMADGSSQGRVSYDKGYFGGIVGGNDIYPNASHPIGEEVYSNNYAFNQLDWLYYNSVVYNPNIDPVNPFVYHGALLYDYGKAQRGFISDYDLNISANLNDRFYAGITFGIKDVHYRSYSEYAELYGWNTPNLGGILLEDHRKISGTGLDMAVGIIVRPIDASPFRVGLSVKSPTIYDLKSENYTAMFVDTRNANSQYLGPSGLDISNSYKFSLYTPWQFGLSVGHTVGKELALGASVEYADYRYTNNRIDDYVDYGVYDPYEDYTHADAVMNHNTKDVMRGVFTFKVGGEYKIIPELALRLGYNYLTPKYSSDGFKDGSLYSVGNNFMSTTEYTNWGSTSRITAGLGYSHKQFSLDLAYQYTQTKGTFYPYFDKFDADNYATSADVYNKLHHMMMTLSYRF